MRFLRAVTAVERQADIVHVERLAREHTVEQRRQLGRDLGPYCHERLTQGRGMLVAEERRVSVVIDQPSFRPPGDEHGLLRAKHHAEQRLQSMRPNARRPERAPLPIVSADQRAHLTAAGEERVLDR